MKAVLTSAAFLAAAAALSAAPAAGQDADTSDRISRLIVYGSDPCPRGTDGEIIVCARRPDSERYRIPRELRDEGPIDPENESWAVRAQSLEFVGRTGIQSCSTVGPAGFTGCWAEMMRAARNDRRIAGEPGR